MGRMSRAPRWIGTATFCLIQVAQERLGETDVVPIPKGLVAVYSSRARSLIERAL